MIGKTIDELICGTFDGFNAILPLPLPINLVNPAVGPVGLTNKFALPESNVVAVFVFVLNIIFAVEPALAVICGNDVLD